MAPGKVLVIALRYIGDTLLTTPLFRSIRGKYPECQLDVLVFESSQAMLDGNPDIDTLIVTRETNSTLESIRLLVRLFRRYDLAFLTQTGDRPFFYSMVASSIRIGPVVRRENKGRWKGFFLDYWTEFDNFNTHTVIQNLKLARLAGMEAISGLRLPSPKGHPAVLEQGLLESRFAVLHMYPKRVYKRWTKDGWVALGRFLREQNVRLVLSGAGTDDEREYIDAIQRRLPDDTINVAGKISLAELAVVIKHACLFVGPDTSVTHMAAATGVPVIALYGPTNPVVWAPWPRNWAGDANPFVRHGSQGVGNVHLLQGAGDCVPCHLEGCDRHRDSRSQCLETLSARLVTVKVQEVLGLSADCPDCHTETAR